MIAVNEGTRYKCNLVETLDFAVSLRTREEFVGLVRPIMSVYLFVPHAKYFPGAGKCAISNTVIR